MIEDGEHHPDLARALKGRNPFDARHNVVGELIQQLDCVGIGIHMYARREALLECARLAAFIADGLQRDAEFRGAMVVRDHILALIPMSPDEFDGKAIAKPS